MSSSLLSLGIPASPTSKKPPTAAELRCKATTKSSCESLSSHGHVFLSAFRNVMKHLCPKLYCWNLPDLFRLKRNTWFPPPSRTPGPRPRRVEEIIAAHSKERILSNGGVKHARTWCNMVLCTLGFPSWQSECRGPDCL